MNYLDYTFDHPLFMLLNFDGGPTADAFMAAVSGVKMWIPMYVLIIWLVWRRYGWRGTVLFVAAGAVAMGLSDMICGIFKHAGLLKHLWPSFPPRWRPMYTPALEGLDITPDSLMAWRKNPTDNLPAAVHLIRCGSRYGTVSAHAATIVSIAVLACKSIRMRWFTWFMAVVTVLICYSRIYLAYHFPGDIVLGAATGAAVGWASFRLFSAARSALERQRAATHRNNEE